MFCDDQEMLADSEAGLQKQMDSLMKTAKDYDMKISSKETKIMMISKDVGGKMSIRVDGQEIERVSFFKYLGSVVSKV